MSHRLERQMKTTVKVVQYYLKVRLLYNYDGTRDASDSHLRQNVVENREQVFKSGFLHWILMINNNNVLYILYVQSQWCSQWIKKSEFMFSCTVRSHSGLLGYNQQRQGPLTWIWTGHSIKEVLLQSD